MSTGHQRGDRSRLNRMVTASVTGTVAYAASQFLLFAILARTSSVSVVGDFALMVSIAAPLFLLVGMNLRIAQATDARGSFRPHDFVNLQVVANSLCVVLALGLLPLWGFSNSSAVAFVIYLLAKAVEAMSTYVYGLFQLYGRMDLVARSLLLRAVLGPTLFGAGLWGDASLVSACSGLLAAWLAAQALDRRRARILLSSDNLSLTRWSDWSRVRRLAAHAWPLGFSGGVNSLSANVPRYAAVTHLGSPGLGVFTGVSYLAQIIQTVIGAIGAALIPDLATHLANRRMERYRSVFRQSVTLTLCVILVALAGGWALGSWFLEVTMGDGYADKATLMSLLAGTGVTALYRCPGRALQAALKFRLYLMIDLLVLLVTAVSAFLLVPLIGLPGAGVAIGLGGLTGLVIASITLARHLRSIAPSHV